MFSLEEVLQRCEIAMALRLCLAPTKTRQMRMRVTGGVTTLVQGKALRGPKREKFGYETDKNTNSFGKGTPHDYHPQCQADQDPIESGQLSPNMLHNTAIQCGPATAAAGRQPLPASPL